MSGSIAPFPQSRATRPPVSFASELRRFLSLAVQEWRLSRDRAELQALDGRALHDIGLTRGSIEGAVRFGRHGAPRHSGGPAEPFGDGAESPAIPSSWTEWR